LEQSILEQCKFLETASEHLVKAYPKNKRYYLCSLKLKKLTNDYEQYDSFLCPFNPNQLKDCDNFE
jgi:hypothetical protein